MQTPATQQPAPDRPENPNIVTATGGVVAQQDLRPGDTVLIWAYPDGDSPTSQRTWNPISPPRPGTTRSHPLPRHWDPQVTEAVIVRSFAHWHRVAAARGLQIGWPIEHRGDPSSPLLGTVDLAMTRQDLINALALTHIDIEADHPIGLDHNTNPIDDQQEDHHRDQTLTMAYRLARTPAPTHGANLGWNLENALPNALMGWRQIGKPVHLSTLRRIAHQEYSVPEAAYTIPLKLRSGDRVAVTAGHHPHTGSHGHAVARNKTSDTPATVVELSDRWHRQIQTRDIFPGILLASADRTALVAMTGPDIDRALDLAAFDAHIFDPHNPPNTDPDNNPHLSRNQRRAIAAYNNLKRQKTAHQTPQTAADHLDYTATANTLTKTAANHGTPIDLGL